MPLARETKEGEGGVETREKADKTSGEGQESHRMRTIMPNPMRWLRGLHTNKRRDEMVEQAMCEMGDRCMAGSGSGQSGRDKWDRRHTENNGEKEEYIYARHHLQLREVAQPILEQAFDTQNVEWQWMAELVPREHRQRVEGVEWCGGCVQWWQHGPRFGSGSEQRGRGVSGPICYSDGRGDARNCGKHGGRLHHYRYCARQPKSHHPDSLNTSSDLLK